MDSTYEGLKPGEIGGATGAEVSRGHHSVGETPGSARPDRARASPTAEHPFPVSLASPPPARHESSWGSEDTDAARVTDGAGSVPTRPPGRERPDRSGDARHAGHPSKTSGPPRWREAPTLVAGYRALRGGQKSRRALCFPNGEGRGKGDREGLFPPRSGTGETRETTTQERDERERTIADEKERETRERTRRRERTESETTEDETVKTERKSENETTEQDDGTGRRNGNQGDDRATRDETGDGTRAIVDEQRKRNEKRAMNAWTDARTTIVSERNGEERENPLHVCVFESLGLKRWTGRSSVW